VWAALRSTGDDVVVNKAFIDEIVAAGDTVIVAGGNYGTRTAQEIQWLVQAGSTG